MSNVGLPLNLFLHKQTSGETSRCHPVCILIAMALRISLYLAFSLIFIYFRCFALFFYWFSLIFIIWPQKAREVSVWAPVWWTGCRIWWGIRTSWYRRPKTNEIGSVRFGSVRFGSVPIIPIWRWCRIVLINRSLVNFLFALRWTREASCCRSSFYSDLAPGRFFVLRGRMLSNSQRSGPSVMLYVPH